MATSDDDVAVALLKVLRSTWSLYVKTHLYHWNVTGAQFPYLHKFFLKQYEDIWEAADRLAERVRGLDIKIPHEAVDSPMIDTSATWKDMIEDLLADHEALVEQMTEANDIARAADDEATSNMLANRIEQHQKHVWMLKATAEE